MEGKNIVMEQICTRKEEIEKTVRVVKRTKEGRKIEYLKGKLKEYGRVEAALRIWIRINYIWTDSDPDPLRSPVRILIHCDFLSLIHLRQH